MKIILRHIINGKTQILDNIVSLAENKNIIEVKTTKEEFKVSKEKVEIQVIIEPLVTNSRDKLMQELNIKMDNLLELQKQNKITNGLEDVEKIKCFINNYDGVSEKDKKELIEGMDILVLEVMLRKKLNK